MTQAIAVQRPVEPAPFPNRPSMLGVGTVIWLGSELMFFSGLFAAYYTIRAHAQVWPPLGDHLDVAQAAAFTLLLVMSSVTMQKAVYEEEHDRRRSARWWLILTFVMGASFVLSQAVEWTTVNFSTSTDAFGSLFYVMSGIHGLHVIIGLVAMIGILGRMVGPSGDPGERTAFQAVSYYWHFVDVVWVGLYCSIFLVH
ncbi:MAG: aa3-type cytochrome oxidase subunit III [Acidimicrobiales bacterium]